MRLATQRDDAGITTELARWLEPYAGWNAFNPSLLLQHDVAHVSFRAFRNGLAMKPFNAYYISGPVHVEHGRTPELVDLTAIAGSHGVAPVADPKTFGTSDRVFVTFNTGFNASTPNDVYIMQVHPSLGAPQRCQLDHRNHTEKNWSFFEAPGEGLFAIYSLKPFLRLRHVDGVLGTGDTLKFERDGDFSGEFVDFIARRHHGVTKRNLSIGTQAIWSEQGLIIVAHEKVYLSKYRGYFGRPVLVRDPLGDDPTVSVARERLIHSVRAALPRRGIHNRIAVFVVYFAGIARHCDKLVLSYGINDRDFGFAEIPAALSW